MEASRTTDSQIMEAFRAINRSIDNGEKILDLQSCFTLPLDGWGIALRLVEKDGVFWIVSAGPDKRFNTEDDRAVLVPVPSENRSVNPRSKTSESE